MEDMDILESLRFAAISSSVIFLLFKTDFISEYASLFRLEWAFGIKRYKNDKIKYPDLSYLSFLNYVKDNFLTRLIACPFCLGFWFCCTSFFFQCNVLVTYCFYLIILRIIMPDIYE